jgi:hypothetical protein
MQIYAIRLAYNFIMSARKTKPYYNTPLNSNKTIDLPSNLLQLKNNLRYQQPEPLSMSATVDITAREIVNPLKAKK